MSKTPLKIGIGSHLRSGPWGGSNQFLVALVHYLQQQNVTVVFDLQEPDIDLILLTDPRRKGMSASFRHKEIIGYLLRKNWNAVVVHRINECDERKRSTDVNAQLLEANFCADHTVFISYWLRDLFLGHGMDVKSTSSVILNGADRLTFHSNGYHPWNQQEKLRMVTHHWGGNWMKGFDIYAKIDELLAKPPFNKKFDFTYIGNVPEGFQFRYARYLPPQSGAELAASLRQHHVYLTASQNEPAGMHHIEGAMCGLPLLYRESGALPDYGQGFGISFTADNFEQKLQEMYDSYSVWAERMAAYPNTAEYMCENYYTLFLKLTQERKTLLRRRTWQGKRARWLLKAGWSRLRKPVRRLKKLKKNGMKAYTQTPEFYTNFRYRDRETKAQYIWLKYQSILQGTKILDVGADGCYLKSHLDEQSSYWGIGLGGTPDQQVNLEHELLPFDDNSFQCVLCFDVLEHVENIHKVFDELCRVSKKYVILSLPNAYNAFLAMLYKGDYRPGTAIKFYGLPLEPPEDRHKWFFSLEEAENFVHYRAAQNRMRILQIDSEYVNLESRQKGIRRWGRLLARTLLFRKDFNAKNLYAQALWAVLEKENE